MFNHIMVGSNDLDRSEAFYNAVLGENPTRSQWNLLFGICAGVLMLSAGTSMVLDASKKIMLSRQPAVELT